MYQLSYTVKQLEANYDDESSDSSDDEEVVTDTPSAEESDSGQGRHFSFDEKDVNMSNGRQKKNSDTKKPRHATVRRTKQKGYWQSFLTGLLEK